MIFLLLGLVSGMIGGMGIGGGAILIPALSLFAGASQHSAQAVNLCYFIPTAVFALLFHIKHHAVRLLPAMWMSLSGIPAAILASSLSARLADHTLRLLFAAFLFSVALFEFFRKEKRPKP